MHVLIVFGTTDGHTRDLCHFAGQRLRDAGHTATVEVAGRDAAHPDVAPYDAVLLAASLHEGHYQLALVQFARSQHENLAAKPNAFLSVSRPLTASDSRDAVGLATCLAAFEQETLWTPKVTHVATGAIPYDQLSAFKRLALRVGAWRRGQPARTSRNYDLTDYAALTTFVLTLATPAVCQLSAPRRAMVSR